MPPLITEQLVITLDSIQVHLMVIMGLVWVSVSVYVCEFSSSHARVFVFKTVHAVHMDVYCLLYLYVSEEM